MRITVGQLRKLIREVTVSPSLKKNNKLIDGPMADSDTAGLVDRLDGAFEQALMMNLVLANFDKHYNAETRDFDDHAYQAIKQRVDAAKSQANEGVKQALNSAWKQAHQAKSEQPAAAPASGVQKKPAAKAA